MAQMVSDLMTPTPETCDFTATATVVEMARKMKEKDIGSIMIVCKDGQVEDVVTDRDIVVVRDVAEGKDPQKVHAGEIFTPSLIKLSPDGPVETAVELMREKKIRRLPAMEKGRAVGIASLGDPAVDRDRTPVLADISSTESNN